MDIIHLANVANSIAQTEIAPTYVVGLIAVMLLRLQIRFHVEVLRHVLELALAPRVRTRNRRRR
jgi:hypothetical protein